jgi:DNA-directed RNA polymerase specialized sigma24 family protein
MASDSEDSTQHSDQAGLFATTHWSVVLHAKEDSFTALSALCATYRRPLIVWLRSRGFAPTDAEDIVHGCLQQLLRRDFLQNVGSEKGRFRTFLLSCLKNYLQDEYKKGAAGKRGGGQANLSLDQTDPEGKPIDAPGSPQAGPDWEYDRAWAQAVLTNALRRLSVECARQGHAAMFSLLEPVLFCDKTASPYRQIGARLGLSEDAVKTAAYRIRVRLKGLIREEVRQTMGNQEDWKQEVRYLIQLFGQPA